MNSSIELAKFEPVPIFEKNINDIKDNHLKIIASSAMNLPDITSSDKDYDPLIMNNSSETAKFEPDPTF